MYVHELRLSEHDFRRPFTLIDEPSIHSLQEAIVTIQSNEPEENILSDEPRTNLPAFFVFLS